MSRFTLIEAVGRPAAVPPEPAPSLALDRREALRLMTAGVTLAIAGCGRPHEEIIPYVDQPEGLTPGIPQRYATTLPLAGYGRGAMAIAYEGRPTKIEGSPKHPFSLGSTDVFAEAEVLSLYDPARLQTVMQGTLPSSWDGLDAALLPRLAQHKRQGGQGLALLTGRVTSPTELRLIKALQAAYPAMNWRRFEPVDDDSARAGALQAFGKPLTLRPRLQDAQVVLALDADPLGPGPEQIANARAYAARRKPDEAGFSRWYVVEGGWTLTGANADHRLAHRPDAIAEVALALAAALGQGGAHSPLMPEAQRFVTAVAADLKANVGRAVVLVGRSQPPEVHALVHALNAGLDAPVDAHAPVAPHPDGHMASLQATAADLRAGRLQHVGQRHPGPASVADGAGLPRVAGDRLQRIELGAAVAGALHRRLHGALREARVQLGERQRQRRGDEALDLQREAPCVDLRHVAVAADVEILLVGGVAAPQRRQLGLGVEGLLRMDDEVLGFGGHLERSSARLRWHACLSAVIGAGSTWRDARVAPLDRRLFLA